MDITIHVSDAVAKILRSDISNNSEAEEILRTAQEHGVVLEPLHPTTFEPALLADFTVNVLDPDTVQVVTQAFMQCRAVEGAYSKSPGEPPVSEP